jgi:predicted RNase H-like HicB family nuclease
LPSHLLRRDRFDTYGKPCNYLLMLYRIVIEQDEDGEFVAECPSLPGCISQGHTRDEAVANIKDAIAGYLASLKKHGEPIPPPITEEIVEVPT